MSSLRPTLTWLTTSIPSLQFPGHTMRCVLVTVCETGPNCKNVNDTTIVTLRMQMKSDTSVRNELNWVESYFT